MRQWISQRCFRPLVPVKKLPWWTPKSVKPIQRASHPTRNSKIPPKETSIPLKEASVPPKFFKYRPKRHPSRSRKRLSRSKFSNTAQRDIHPINKNQIPLPERLIPPIISKYRPKSDPSRPKRRLSRGLGRFWAGRMCLRKILAVPQGGRAVPVNEWDSPEADRPPLGQRRVWREDLYWRFITSLPRAGPMRPFQLHPCTARIEKMSSTRTISRLSAGPPRQSVPSRTFLRRPSEDT